MMIPHPSLSQWERVRGRQRAVSVVLTSIGVAHLL
jgi:hypothetical protein